MKKYKYRIFRRIVQLGILFLFLLSSKLSWDILSGNYSAAYVFGKFHLVDPFAVLQIAFTGSIVAKEALIGAAIVLLFYVLFLGRGFCTWVCPVNIITDLAFWARKKLNIPQEKSFLKRNTRYWILALSLVLSTILGVAAFEFISPISILHRGIIFGVGFGWLIILIIFLFDFAIIKHGWCGHLCPLGAFYALTGRFRLLKIKHNADKCTMCMKCFEVCPEKQVLEIIGKKTEKIKSGECNNCGRCIEVCDDRALNF